MSKMPETWIDPEGPGPVYIELIDLHSSDNTGPRVAIPLPGRARVEWLRGTRKKCNALVEIAHPGQICLTSWQPYAEEIIRRQRELQSESDDENLDELVWLAERYRRVYIDNNGRFPVRDRELFHLGLGPNTGWHALLICMPNRIEIWNEEYRRNWRDRSSYEAPWTTR